MDNQDVNLKTTENRTDKETSITNTKSLPAPLQQVISRNPPWTYFKLHLISQSTRPIRNLTIDALTARTYLTAALSQFLGLMGTSISIDILKIEQNTASDPPEVWIRVPRDDAAAVFAALSSWVGALPAAAVASSSSPPSSSYGGAAASVADSGVAWRVCAKGNYLAAIVHGSGDDAFQP
ncbi:hypothetical protein UA08_00205 [Talaromyces atroroseus]|uniref:Ribonucleases P/MRP subunit Pop8-like domain-containing protein n=1 Tax=Talaromyces atroroseus TaxID=1441469 RepID=A0A225AZB9_TALAT|nr:hypothetical protein UA08_00205 [Talaromyces atroroseus]OKL63794.1 hypothetical protein UA08_00205 [Talaromyces atroroseus]